MIPKDMINTTLLFALRHTAVDWLLHWVGEGDQRTYIIGHNTASDQPWYCRLEYAVGKPTPTIPMQEWEAITRTGPTQQSAIYACFVEWHHQHGTFDDQPKEDEP